MSLLKPKPALCALNGLACLACLSVLLAAPGPVRAKARVGLSGARLVTLEKHSRLVFSFSRPVKDYTIGRGDADEIRLDFGPGRPYRLGWLDLCDDMVESVVVLMKKGSIGVRVKVKAFRFSLRHFIAPGRKSVVLDLRSTLIGEKPSPAGPKGLYLARPFPRETALKVIKQLPSAPAPGTDLALLAAAAEGLAAGEYAVATASLERFKKDFPASPILDLALFLLGDAYFFSAPDDFSSSFQRTVSAYQEAADAFPLSPQVPRARLMTALAYLKMEYLREALECFKDLRYEYPDSPEAVMARVYMGEIYFMLGRIQLAKAEFDAVRALSPKGPLFPEAYFRLGRAYFKDGLYSQALEVFKEILGPDPRFYLRRPDILYYMGEGYFHLGRTDLSRDHLYHILNIDPKHEAGDLILARIGDTYMKEERDEEAIKVYTLVRKHHPGTTGALISRLRLADYKAWGGVFKPEEGGLEAALETYREIIASKKDSPLAQVAMFRLGRTYYSQGDNVKAVKVLSGIVENYPESSLTEEACRVLSQALLLETRDLYQAGRYFKLLSFYSENKHLIDKDARPEIRHYLALTHLSLDLNQEAARLLEANEDQTVFEDQRLWGLGRAYFKLGRYKDAARTLSLFRFLFPEHKKAARALVDQAGAEWALGETDAALVHLEEALENQPGFKQDGEIQSLLGRIYLKKGDLKKGAAALEAARTAMKGRQEAGMEIFLILARLGQTYQGLGRKREAVEALDEALKLLPQEPFPEALYLIARSFKKLGRVQRAKTVLEVMLKAPDGFWRKAAREELEAIESEPLISRMSPSRPNRSEGPSPAGKHLKK